MTSNKVTMIINGLDTLKECNKDRLFCELYLNVKTGNYFQDKQYPGIFVGCNGHFAYHIDIYGKKNVSIDTLFTRGHIRKIVDKLI